jgi:NAD(P)-dependent dehydrogenase (short-subunit alcohol dehydrogenase family)
MAAYRGAGAYGVSKLALNGVTMALATELAPLGIRVNGIAPGLVDSPAAMGLLPEAMQEFVLAGQLVKRIGRMEDLAPMLVYLCSADSSFVTGQTFLVDGGATPRA